MNKTNFMPMVLVTKIAFDGHDRGSRIVAAALRDAGMEVIYTPPWQEIATVVKLATGEDVDVIGISSLATDHLNVPQLMAALREAGRGDVCVIVGGMVPDEDGQMLLDAGVSRVLHSGTALEAIASHVRQAAALKRQQRAMGQNRYRARRFDASVVFRQRAGSAKLLIESIRLVHQRSCNHGHDHPHRHAAASAHDRRPAHAQAEGQDPAGLRSVSSPSISVPGTSRSSGALALL